VDRQTDGRTDGPKFQSITSSLGNDLKTKGSSSSRRRRRRSSSSSCSRLFGWGLTALLTQAVAVVAVSVLGMCTVNSPVMKICSKCPEANSELGGGFKRGYKLLQEFWAFAGKIS